MSDFKKIAVLMGGTSNEREVSLASGRNVADALESLGRYDVRRVVLDTDDLSALPASVDACYVALHGGWGENGGVQADLIDAGNAEVASVFEGSPAKESGVEVGDVIASINDEMFLGKTPEDAANKIKGESGSTVKMVFIRGNETFELNIERREIKIYHASSRLIDGHIGYIFLYTFDFSRPLSKSILEG